jgi:hypothetical protein
MTSPGPLQHTNLFHTGIVVADLAAAKAEYAERFGVSWTEGGAEVVLLTDDGAQVVQSAFAFSKEGPHHLELAQAVPGTIWTVTAPGRVHHLGYWVDSVPDASAALAASGCPLAASVAMAEDAPPMCAYHSTENGIIVEVVSRALRRVLLPGT